MTPEQHEAEACRWLQISREHHDLSGLGPRQTARSALHNAGVFAKAVAELHDELAAVKRRAELYRADAIEHHRIIVECETLTATKRSEWECLSTAALLAPDDQPRRSVAFLEAEGLIEKHPTREGVYRPLDEPQGGG